MNTENLKNLLLGTTLLVGFSTIGFGQAYAQTSDDAAEQVEEVVEEDESDEIVVTGSRLKRSTFNSIKPLQTIDFEETREVGLLDTIEILQTNEAAAGTQIDSSFGGFVLDNGPGSETINLRGLGADRTLVLVNGRRLAPLGVEGAPAQASINAIPSILIESADLLLEGASSVYGSDAIAGVINATLARDFEGFQVQGSTEIAEQGGEDFTVSARWGKNFDRAFFGVAAEYDRRAGVRIDDRDFFADCETNVEIDENGNIRNNNVENAVAQELFGLQANPVDINNPCIVGGTTSRFIELSPGVPFGSVFANRSDVNADETVLGIPGFTDPFVFFPFDADGDRVIDNSLRQFSINGNDNTAHIIAPQERVNIFSYGEYTFDGEANITPFFEVLYSRNEIEQDLGIFQLFPTVGADNPFNPCGTNGVDCGSSANGPNGLFNRPSFVQDFNTFQRELDPNRDGDIRDARICATFGAQPDPNNPGSIIPGTGPFDNAACTPQLFGFGAPAGAIDVQPVVTIDGDRSLSQIELEQTRLVGGVRGDIPQFNFDPEGFLNFSDWSFEVSGQYSISNGRSSRRGIREDRLNLSLGNAVQSFTASDGTFFAQGDPVPGLDACVGQPGLNLPTDVTAGCVPVNLFAAPALEIQGNLSPAEEAFLFDSRDFDTRYFQTVLNAFIAGKVADLPAGDLQASLGVEWRNDEIDSQPDDIAANGLFFGFFSDQGAAGSRSILEGFGEVSIPLVADQPFFKELTVEGGFRVLDDEFFGQEAVYSVAGGWRPVESLLLRGSYGTSFRAPNLRELFQRPQTGFLNVFDPCIAPQGAFIGNLGDPNAPDVFDPNSDLRDPDVIARCLAEGLPQDLGGGNVNPLTQVEVFGEGNLDLDPETSTSLNLGASFEQPFFEAFDFTFGVNYYDIDVQDTVVTPGAQFIVNDCFVVEQDNRSIFCDRIERNQDQIIDFIGQGFINLNEEEVRGLDFNANFSYDFNAFGQPFEYRLAGRANHLLERRTLFIGDNGEPLEEEFQGEPGFPEWTGSLVNRLGYKDFTFNWFTRYVGDIEQDVDGIDDFGNAFGLDTDDDGFADTFSDTCLGPNFGDVNCRDVGFTNDYFVHNLSVNYTNRDSNFSITFGVNNVFDRDPPAVNGGEGFAQISNVPLGQGFALNGRTFVGQITKGF
jgi:iron complex outermembrane receptor protein